MLERIMGFVSDHLLDSIWAGLYARQYARAAGRVAFMLAFNSELTSDDEGTIASKSKRPLNTKSNLAYNKKGKSK